MIPQPGGPAPGWRAPFQKHWALLALALVLVGVAAIRIRLLDFPLERDEGEYAYAGQLMLAGVPPYQLAYNMKFPGTYAAYALIMAVFGETPAGIHLGVSCVTTLTAFIIYRFGKELLDDTAGVVAGAAYAVLAASPNLLGLAGHATHFAALFSTGGLYLLWPVRQTLSWKRALAAGLMFGTAVLMKQPAAVFGAWGLAILLVAVLRLKTIPASDRRRTLAAFCTGMFLPFALTCLLLWRAGVLERFWFWTVNYAREYATRTPLHRAPANFWDGFVGQALTGTVLIWALAASAAAGWFDDRLRNARWPLAGFVVAAFASTCPGLVFREHYFLLTLPAVALLAGIAVSCGRRFAPRLSAGVLPATWPVWGCGLILAITAFQNRQIWFVLEPVAAARAVYPDSPFPEAEVVAAFIQKHSAPGDTVAVLGSEPEIYFLAHRRSATGYIYVYPLTELQPFAARMHSEMIHEIETNQPAFVVFVMSKMSWLVKPQSNLTIVDWWLQSYRTDYESVGTIATAGSIKNESLTLYRRKNFKMPVPPTEPDSSAGQSLR